MNTKYSQNELGFCIHISTLVLEVIRMYGLKYYPKEFGGIFLGHYSENGKDAYITEVVVPTKFKSRKTEFTRHPDNLNVRIKQVYDLSEGKINYIGEWHTHPNGAGQFSATDIETMKDISGDIDVKIDSPLLVIVLLTKEQFEPTFYICHKGKMFQYTQL